MSITVRNSGGGGFKIKNANIVEVCAVDGIDSGLHVGVPLIMNSDSSYYTNITANAEAVPVLNGKYVLSKASQYSAVINLFEFNESTSKIVKKFTINVVPHTDSGLSYYSGLSKLNENEVLLWAYYATGNPKKDLYFTASLLIIDSNGEITVTTYAPHFIISDTAAISGIGCYVVDKQRVVFRTKATAVDSVQHGSFTVIRIKTDKTIEYGDTLLAPTNNGLSYSAGCCSKGTTLLLYGYGYSKHHFSEWTINELEITKKGDCTELNDSYNTGIGSLGTNGKIVQLQYDTAADVYVCTVSYSSSKGAGVDILKKDSTGELIRGNSSKATSSVSNPDARLCIIIPGKLYALIFTYDGSSSYTSMYTYLLKGPNDRIPLSTTGTSGMFGYYSLSTSDSAQALYAFGRILSGKLMCVSKQRLVLQPYAINLYSVGITTAKASEYGKAKMYAI